MTMGLLGTKVGMTQVYDSEGKIAPVTVLQVGPCPVLQIRNLEKDKYHAVQLGYRDKPRRKATRAESGHVSGKMTSKRRTAGKKPLAPKAEVEPQRHIREFRFQEAPAVQVGEVLTVDKVFGEIKRVDVVGTSKGRGYSGVMKRHNYKGLRKSHGVKKGSRQRGSIASNASNRGSGRPKRGIRMAGQYGNTQTTSRNLRIVKFDAENNLLLVEGAVPGPNGGFVIVRPTRKKTRPQPVKK